MSANRPLAWARSGPRRPPAVGRLVCELIARGSRALAVSACTVCGRAAAPLTRVGTAVCAGAARLVPRPPRAWAAARSNRSLDARAPARRSARCAAATSGDDARAGCAGGPPRSPICKRRTPRRQAAGARCDQVRPPVVRWDEGPLCESKTGWPPAPAPATQGTSSAELHKPPLADPPGDRAGRPARPAHGRPSDARRPRLPRQTRRHTGQETPRRKALTRPETGQPATVRRPRRDRAPHRPP